MYSRGLLPAGALERLSDVVYRTMLNDTLAASGTRPEDTWGRLLTPARPTHSPSIRASEKSLPRPANSHLMAPAREAF
jgi:hypothetical protein